ncbi:MAG: DUF4857 domain-containing protein [Deltaproteobacteria bacterium]|nr:DUF4857 domain-containing protein [Candidatus Anaeroferrophillacea bacterium]
MYPALKTRHIKVREIRRRECHGLLLTGDAAPHLLTSDDYRPVRLPLVKYDPDRMDFKLIVNPPYRTAIRSDDAVIRAVAMDREYNVLARCTHPMSRAAWTMPQTVRQVLFPFSPRPAAVDGAAPASPVPDNTARTTGAGQAATRQSPPGQAATDQGPAARTAARSPFDESSAAIVPDYRYEEAAAAMRLTGVIGGNDTRRAIVLLDGRYQIVAPGARLNVTLNGLPHIYTVRAIAARELTVVTADGRRMTVESR